MKCDIRCPFCPIAFDTIDELADHLDGSHEESARYLVQKLKNLQYTKYSLIHHYGKEPQ